MSTNDLLLIFYLLGMFIGLTGGVGIAISYQRPHDAVPDKET
jgi:hypothetical protein